MITSSQTLDKSEQKRIDHLNKLLAVGDMKRLGMAFKLLPESTTRLPEYKLLLSKTMMGLGKFSEASYWIKSYLEQNAEDFEAFLWLNMIENFTEESDTIFVETNARKATSIAYEYINLLPPNIKQSPPEVLRYIITDQTISFSFKRLLAATLFKLFQQNSKSMQQAGLIGALMQESESWPVRDQLFWIGLVLFYIEVTEERVQVLARISTSDELELEDLFGIVALINTIISRGNTAIVEHRFGLLSKVYVELMKRIKQEGSVLDADPRIFYNGSSAKTNKVAIHSAPLLGFTHAPTNRVLEIASSLKKDFGYDVRIFASGSFFYWPDVAVPDFGYANALALPSGASTLLYKDQEIEVWTSYLDDSQYKKHYATVSEIINFDPDVVFLYGDCHPVHEMLFGKIPTILQTSISTPPVGPSDVYVSVWSDKKIKNFPNGHKWPAEVLGSPLFIPQLANIPRPTKRLTRDGLAPNCQTLLSIAGTRLTTEVRGEFAERLCAFLIAHPDTHLLAIGVNDKQELIGEELALADNQIHCVEYSDGLLELLTGCDIYLNPKRIGGGTSMLLAMSAGCGIVSLNYGDGAIALEVQDLSNDFDSYFSALDKLVSNEETLSEMRRRMPKLVHEVCDFGNAMERLVNKIEELATDFRVRG